MSTGLVPITNAVSAIPEFVDSSSGILAPGEDYMAMAAGIDRLYWNPQYFLELSRNAAARVRAQSAAEFTIDRELNLINNYMSISIFGSCVSRALQGEVL
jgi:glycosyltransferase involved in cell wall biosynthesis